MSRKERLTLSQLASYDDVLTDVLIDHVGDRLATYELSGSERDKVNDLPNAS